MNNKKTNIKLLFCYVYTAVQWHIHKADNNTVMLRGNKLGPLLTSILESKPGLSAVQASAATISLQRQRVV